SARDHLEQGVALYDTQNQNRHSYTSSGTLDPGVACLSLAAYVLWQLGYSAQTPQKNHKNPAPAQELSHLHSVALARQWAGLVYLSRGEWQAAQEQAEAMITLSIEQEFPYWLAGGTLLQGEALAEQSQVEEGILQIRQSLTAWRATR